MTHPLDLGLRGMAHVEIGAVGAAASALAGQLGALLHGAPLRLSQQVLASPIPAPPAALPAAERAAALGRSLARAFDTATEPVLASLVEACSVALVAETKRLECFGEVVDVLVGARAPGGASLVRQLAAYRDRFLLLGSTESVAPARTALLYALAGDLGLRDAAAALRTGDGEDAAGRLHAALTASFPTGDAARAVLERRATLLFAPLTDLLDLHLEAAFAA
jgi:hypothetical protein